MIKETEVTKTFKEKHRHCDECGTEINATNRYCSCKYCGKDLCRKCIGHEEDDRFSDYPEVYCKRCWDIGEFYRPTIEAMESSIEELYDKWIAECRLVPSGTDITK